MAARSRLSPPPAPARPSPSLCRDARCRTSRPAAIAKGETLPMPQTILIVDDDEAIRQTLAELLEEEGYQVATAADGLEALAQVVAAPPALILLDISMPRMDGFDFARELSERRLRDSICL